MKIYLDLIMILNFCIDFILLLSVSIILKRNANINKLLIGAFVGGISILTLFININSIVLFIFKFGTSILMILLGFGYKNIKYTIKNIVYLYMSSIVLGGFLYLLNIEFSYKHIGLIFFNKGLSVNFILLLIISPIIIFIYIKQSKELKYNYSNYYTVYIYNNNRKYKYTAYMDTGNILIDNLTSKKVILIDKRKLLFNIKEFRLVPFVSAGGRDLLKVIKIEKIVFNNVEYNDVLLGIIDNISIDGVDIILNRKLLEE